MDAINTHVAGVDVHKEELVITTLVGLPHEKAVAETFNCKTFTEDLKAAGLIILSKGVKHVAMESTGIYWKPIYNVWREQGLIITLGNAAHMKNVPGRKTDKVDSLWIAKLHRCGLIRPSYIPEEKFQEMRAYYRHRTTLVSAVASIKNRVQKILEDGNIKLGSVLSDVFGEAGQAVLRELILGKTDAITLSSVVVTKIKKKGDLVKALTNCIKPYHIQLLKMLVQEKEFLQKQIDEIDNKLHDLLKEDSIFVEKLSEVPGIEKTLAVGILSEATSNMSSFKDAKSFAAWAGVAPGNNESAGKKKSQKLDKAILV